MDTVKEIRQLFDDQQRSVQAKREVDLMQQRLDKAVDNISNLMTAGGPSLFKDKLEGLLLAAQGLQESLLQDRSVTDVSLRLLALKPEQLVAITYHQLLAIASKETDNGFDYSAPRRTIERRIGSAVGHMAMYNMMHWVRCGAKKPQNNTPLVTLADQYGVSPDVLSRWRSRQLPACMREIAEDGPLIGCGYVVLNAMLPVVEDLFLEHKRLKADKRETTYITVRPTAAERLELEMIEGASASAALGFMVCEPNDLTETSYHARGAYVTHARVQTVTPLRPSSVTIEAANTTQRVPYTINRVALKALKALTASERAVLVKVADIPEAPNDGESNSQFAARVHSVMASNLAKTKQLESIIEASDEACEFPKIYFPVYLDFRGRQYTVDYKGLGPQATKTAKALLQFVEGRPLGSTGLRALYHELGNAMGYDKDLMADKIAKAEQLPISDLDSGVMSSQFWMTAEEPLKALTIAYDILQALKSGNPETYVSQQIVYVDGSCNGMQHLSMMTRDPEGGRATNVAGDESTRSDLYSIVGETFLKVLEDDDSEEATYWKQFDLKSIRKVVKRGVMTLPYGVTKQGIGDQVINDGFCSTKDRTHEKTRLQAAKFRDTLWAAMDGAAPKAMEVRAWLIEAVSALCGSGVAPVWTTPTGTTVIKAYRKPSYKKVKVMGLVTNLPSFSNTAGQVDIRKNKAAIVANLIHSYDAAMLQETVRRMVSNGVTTMSFVHDSYGCTAGDMDTMNATLREVAYDIYSVDQMANIAQQLQGMTEAAIPAPPEMGQLDIAAVLKSPYFFA